LSKEPLLNTGEKPEDSDYSAIEPEYPMVDTEEPIRLQGKSIVNEMIPLRGRYEGR
jgi:hypothetical protein